MSWDLLVGCIIIIIARVGDVSLGTLRTLAVVNGHRLLAWLFGLLEVTIWVFVVSAVITHIQTNPAYGIAFAVGAATGNYVGVTVQRWLPFGHQVIRVFTRHDKSVIDSLRQMNIPVTRFQGVGRDGEVAMLFVQVRRDRTPLVVRAVRKHDPRCFYTVDDIRVADTATIATPQLTDSPRG